MNEVGHAVLFGDEPSEPLFCALALGHVPEDDDQAVDLVPRSNGRRTIDDIKETPVFSNEDIFLISQCAALSNDS